MTTSPEGIALLGSEMLTWSDLEGELGGFGGLLAPHLLHAFGGHRGRVLVAGPTTAEVVAGVAGQFEAADVLVRSWLDAQALRAALDQSVSVHCGPLDRLPRPEAGYDAVVAVAGIDRLHSAEEDTPSWRTVLGHLAGLLNETGELYVALGNPVGVDRLVTVPTPTRTHDADWPQGRAGVEDPHDSAEVLGHLAEAHGLVEVDTWVCHGPRLDPTTASPGRVLTGLRADPVLLREVSAGYRDPGAVPAGLRDPATAARELVRAGLGVATAPVSVLHVRRGERAAETTRTVLLVSEPAGPARAAYALEREGDGWQRSLLVPAATHDVTPSLRRDLGLLEGPVPSGPLLADALADHCAQHDASGAGVLVRRYRDWLGDADPVDPARVATTLDRIVVVDDGLAAADASHVAAAGADRDTVLVRTLLRFAADLLGRGGRHPWSSAATPRGLAGSLAAAAGLEVDDALVEAAVALDRSLQPPGAHLDVEAPLGGLTGTSYADLLELAQDLAQRAADQDAHVVWLLRAMQGRQRAIRKARGNLRQVSESREYRLGRRVFWIRDRMRQRAERREDAERGPAGEWRDRSDEAEENEPVVVEEHLVPPGYTPPPDVKVIPTGTDNPPD